MSSRPQHALKLDDGQPTSSVTEVVYEYRGAIIHAFAPGSLPPGEPSQVEHMARVIKLVDAWVDGPRPPDPGREVTAGKGLTTELQTALLAPRKHLSLKRKMQSHGLCASLIVLLLVGLCCLR